MEFSHSSSTIAQRRTEGAGRRGTGRLGTGRLGRAQRTSADRRRQRSCHRRRRTVAPAGEPARPVGESARPVGGSPCDRPGPRAASNVSEEGDRISEHRDPAAGPSPAGPSPPGLREFSNLASCPSPPNQNFYISQPCTCLPLINNILRFGGHPRAAPVATTGSGPFSDS